MANLSGVNPNLKPASATTRRHDPIDEALTIGKFAAINETTNGTAIALKAEKIGPYLAVIAHSFAGLAADSHNYTVLIQGANATGFSPATTLASIRLSGGATDKEYLALDGAAVESLRKAADHDEVLYVRARAVKTGDPEATLTATVYLTCD